MRGRSKLARIYLACSSGCHLHHLHHTLTSIKNLEAPNRFELLNEGFAVPSLSHLGTAPF